MGSSSTPTPPHHQPAATGGVSATSGGSTSITDSISTTTATTTIQQGRSKALQVISRMAGGVVLLAMPVGYWWYTARQERQKIMEEVRTKIRIPGQETMDEIMIANHCQPGDVVVFDRRCETACATSPWAALACFASQQFLCSSDGDNKNKGHRCFNHMGLIVPGYINSRHDAHDATNLLLLEATPSEGIVARPLLSRLEHSQARSVWLLQLACPGEQRRTSTSSSTTTNSSSDEQQESSSQQPLPKSVREARHHVERQLIKFRNQWTELSQQQGYEYMHSTLCIGGALAYQTGLLKRGSGSGNAAAATTTDSQLYKGPVSPSAWLCFMGLQQANAAQNIHDAHRQLVRVQDFVNVSTRTRINSSSRSSSTGSDTDSEDVIRLRPGWRFLKPIPLRENNAPQS
jgi:hypothetical protein